MQFSLSTLRVLYGNFGYVTNLMPLVIDEMLHETAGHCLKSSKSSASKENRAVVEESWTRDFDRFELDGVARQHSNLPDH